MQKNKIECYCWPQENDGNSFDMERMIVWIMHSALVERDEGKWWNVSQQSCGHPSPHTKAWLNPCTTKTPGFAVAGISAPTSQSLSPTFSRFFRTVFFIMFFILKKSCKISNYVYYDISILNFFCATPKMPNLYVSDISTLRQGSVNDYP